MMSIDSKVRVLILMFLYISLGKIGVIDAQPNWYQYTGSEEERASEAATTEILKLAPRSRTQLIAINECRKLSFSCGWILLNKTNSDRPIAVSCFNEWQRQCNRNQSGEAKSVSRYRAPQCNLCSPCASHNWPYCNNCEKVCRCTCQNGTNNVAGSARQQLYYSCENFCDGNNQCGNSYDEMPGNRNDGCSFYKQFGNSLPTEFISDDGFQYNIIIQVLVIIVCIVIVALIVFVPLYRYLAYRKAMQNQPPAPQQMVALPSEEQQHEK